MNNQSASVNKKKLRQQIRSLRQQLSKEQCFKAGQLLAQQFQQHFVDQDFKKIAVYLQNDNELDTSVLIERFFQSNNQVYLPKVSEDGSNQLQFLHYHSNSRLQNNRFGIPEPVSDDIIDLQNIDLLLIPLTVFDLSGNRIGMGGGYYDRALSKLSDKKPLLVGIAYDFQQVEECPVESFDQPLQMILTPTRAIAFNGSDTSSDLDWIDEEEDE